MKITFIRPYAVKDGTGTKYAEGQVIDCSEASAQHFISRGAAVPGVKEEKKSEPEKEEKGKKK